MNIFRTRWVRIPFGVVLVAYLVTAAFGVPAVHRQVRQDAEEYHQRVPQVSAVVRFFYTFPLLPGLILCRYDLGDGAFAMEGHRKIFLFIFGKPHEVHRSVVWIS